MSDKYWSLYILLKHLCEVVVLTLELIISTAIKSYDSRAQPVLHTPGSARGQAAGAQVVPSQQSVVTSQQSVVTSQAPRGSTHPARDRLSGQYAPITSSQPLGTNGPVATYGATATTSAGAGGRMNRNSSGKNSGRYEGSEHGVELATERTPMLHQQYNAVGNNDV